MPRKTSAGTSMSRRTDSLGLFIEEHILGIITQFANAINDVQIRQPLMEKKRILVAIGEMIKIANGHISSALPQVWTAPLCSSRIFRLTGSDMCLLTLGA